MVKLNDVTNNRASVFSQVCGKRGIELSTSHRVNTGVYGKGKDLIYGELLGGVILLPKSLGLRIRTLNEVMDNMEHDDFIKDLIPVHQETTNNAKVVVLPERFVLEMTPKCCNQIVDWAAGEPCFVIPMGDTPPELIAGLHKTGDNFTILSTNTDRHALMVRSKEAMFSTVDALGIVAVWYNKPFSFLKEGGKHDFGPFRLINILLANDLTNRRIRLNNLLNSELGGFFLPTKNGINELNKFLDYYEDRHGKFTNTHRT